MSTHAEIRKWTLPQLAQAKRDGRVGHADFGRPPRPRSNTVELRMASPASRGGTGVTAQYGVVKRQGSGGTGVSAQYC